MSRRLETAVEALSYPARMSRGKAFILEILYRRLSVDEVAAEHVDAMSWFTRRSFYPTARLPVIYVFTTRTDILRYGFGKLRNIHGQGSEDYTMQMSLTPTYTRRL